MKSAGIVLLFSILSTFTTIAQQNCNGKVVPYKISIGGHTDSVSKEALLKAGKIESVNKAFTIISFTLSGGGNCLKEGLYSSVNCESASFSPMAINFIKRMPPGYKFYIDCIRSKNSIDQEYYLKPQVMTICVVSPATSTKVIP
jgi:hypothetical protein